MNKIISRTFITGLLGFLLFVSNSLYAATPSLSFNGTFDYTAATSVSTPGFLTITGSLYDFQGISSIPVLTGSQFSLTTQLLTENFTTTSSEGVFGSANGTAADLSIYGGDGASLLFANVAGLSMSGINGVNFGSLSGSVMSTGGTLATDFLSTSTLLGLEFNLSTVFGQNMFQSDFNGNINGSLRAVSVAESTAIYLFGVGLLVLFGLLMAQKRNNNFI